MAKQDTVLSVVVPVFNEAEGLAHFNDSLLEVLNQLDLEFEVIYCDDGSTDNTSGLISKWAKTNRKIKLIRLSRNFGKENALTAGIAAAQGEAILMIDGDGQHPVELIPRFISAGRGGAKVVVGMRSDNTHLTWFKNFMSGGFYKVFNRLTHQKLMSGTTDFRLIDRSVQQVFLTLTESGRITRGLIDWLGFEREYITFKARPRLHGQPRYSYIKLVKLAANSLVSLSPKPLYVFGYLGIFITIGSFLLGTAVFIEQILLGDPGHWKFTGTAMLGILLLFLVGILLMSQGILSLYISHIHNQSKNR